MSIGFYNPLESMWDEPCIFCGKVECDVLIQQQIPGGSYALAHKPCLDSWMKEQSDGKTNPDQRAGDSDQPEERKAV